MAEATRAGIRLAYDFLDGPGRPLVFIHGWCCDRSYLAPQVRRFAAAGHAVLAMDLRGHGGSDAPDGPYPIATFADDVAWLCGEVGLARPVAVGHSMGGIIAFDFARRHPGAVGGIVMIDSAVARPAASRAALPAFIERLRGPDAVGAVRDYVRRALFLATDDTARRDGILAAMGRTPAHVMAAALQGMYDFEPTMPAADSLPPALFVASNAPPLCDLPRLAAIVPGLMTAQTAGSGHFAPLEVPDQVNAMIARFAEIIDRSSPDAVVSRTG